MLHQLSGFQLSILALIAELHSLAFVTCCESEIITSWARHPPHRIPNKSLAMDPKTGKHQVIGGLYDQRTSRSTSSAYLTKQSCRLT